MPMTDTYLHRAATDRPYFSEDGETYLSHTSLRDLRKRRPLRVLSEEQFAFWQTYGYVVVKRAVPREDAQRLLTFAWDFQGLDPDRPETWYEEREYRSELDQELHIYGFVEAYHHQLMWDNRQCRRVYDAFVDVWDCEELWVTLDRLNLNPPNMKTRDRSLIEFRPTGFDIELHWDVDTVRSVPPQRVQGILVLNDTVPEEGGFQCCPELFRQFDHWKAHQPADRDPIRPAVDRDVMPVVHPELEAGDLLIFNGHLAHGVAPNISAAGARAVQYLSMMPALEEHEELRRSRIESWRTLSTPTWNKTLLGDAVRPEAERYGRARLNELGERLLGLKSWHDADTYGGVRCAESA
ncbi:MULTISPECIES: phytanoyl-CoA dioxygenase family protein [unclassified Streptomyces]|uniref:phytanoyl-CoA dioxygenase family protein n=1 Tax=unclassified Streptomyces TaxID=2593676 RepID=UPI000DAE74BB|nr:MULTISPECIES: phytanoyl-CoA dioxygenase family protein [unclassified Streptomyces]PZT71778.1 phytanoyl-CoA dioxygenase [Streptomyces sp. AC1-42T]PZT73097.1 phytanoyl-CoA dioxygenase [Streptomyces sp. AC1-42W]